jgi:AraC-like DNA-binding protein
MWHEPIGSASGAGAGLQRPIIRTISPTAEGPFRMDLAVRRLASPTIAHGIGTGACVERIGFTVGFTARLEPELIAMSNDDVILLVQETGRRNIAQCGREATVEPGAGLVVSNSDIDKHIVQGPSRFICVGAPRKTIMALAPGVEDAFLRPLPPDAGVLRLLTKYLAIVDDEEAMRDAKLQLVAATHIHDLFALAVGATRDAAEMAKGRGLSAARLSAVKADITEHLGDAKLRATAIALRQGITPRYIHKLFEGEGTTLSRYVSGQRLVRVHRMLSDPRYHEKTIGSLAYDAGFGDLSTFNREFRRQFGMTPSDVRALAGRTARSRDMP